MIALFAHSVVGFGQNDSCLSNKVNWQDVTVMQCDSLYFMAGANGEGEINRRQNVHSLKDLNKREIKRIKKMTASCGATFAYVSFTMSDEKFIYYLCILPEKDEKKNK